MRTQTTPMGMLVPARRSPHVISRGFAESDPVPTTQPSTEMSNATETVGPTKNH